MITAPTKVSRHATPFPYPTLFRAHVVIHQYCRPIWAAWMDALALSGRLPMPDYFRNRREWLRVLWVPQGWPYFNPVQDVDANTKAVRAGITSRSAVILAQGDDPDQVMEDVTADNEAADAAGHIYDRPEERRGGKE